VSAAGIYDCIMKSGKTHFLDQTFLFEVNIIDDVTSPFEISISDPKFLINGYETDAKFLINGIVLRRQFDLWLNFW